MIYKQKKYGLLTPKGTIYVMKNYPILETRDGRFKADIINDKDFFSSEPVVMIGENYNKHVHDKLRQRGFKPIDGFFVITHEDALNHGIKINVGSKKKSLDLIMSQVCSIYSVRKFDIVGKSVNRHISKARAIFAFVSYYGANATYGEIGKKINRTDVGTRNIINGIFDKYTNATDDSAKEYEDVLINFGLNIYELTKSHREKINANTD
jgi:acetolactate synthase regulatory subunit